MCIPKQVWSNKRLAAKAVSFFNIIMTKKLFSELGLSAELLKAIDKLGFEQASPVQSEAIPVLLAGRDVVGQSQTGSGKTAAFGLPAIEKVDTQVRAVQVLILCPTRELAVQVSEEIHKLALFKRGIHALPIYGGQSYERQFAGLRDGAQIVIGTPGRVMDHMRRGTMRLNQVKMVVLDEADVMLDMGFRDDIEIILKGVPKERQTVFFSATMPRAIQELIQRYSRDPQTIRIEQKAMTVPTVEQTYYEVDRRFKVELLTRLIDLHDLRLGIIFCNTKRMVDDLVEHLNAQGYSADRLHGDMTQPMRDRVMNKFRKSGLEFLVATDVAARGIDVDNVQVVFNYDLPYDGQDYLHRVGRTGRAGRSGMAISFASGREIFQISQIERFTRVKMRRGKPPSANEVEEARAGAALDKLRATLQSGEFKRQDALIERLLEEGFTSVDIASALLHQLQSGQGGQDNRAAGQRDDTTADLGKNRRSDYETADRRTTGRRDERARDNRPEERQNGTSRPPMTERRPSPWQDRDRRSGERVPRKAHTPRPPEPQRENGSLPSALSPSEAETEKPAEKDQAHRPLPVAFPQKMEKGSPQPGGRPAKPSRATPAERTRLYMSVGEEMGIAARDVVGAILGETGLPAAVVGTVDIRARHLFVDVTSEHASGILSKMNRTKIKGHKLKAKVA